MPLPDPQVPLVDPALDVPTWGGEDGAGEYTGGPASQDAETGTNATTPGGEPDHPPGGKPAASPGAPADED